MAERQRKRLWSAPRTKVPRVPKPPRFPVVQRGPASTRVPELGDPNTPPASWTGTQPEWWVYQWLVRRGLKEGVDFKYQANVEGGRLRVFGMVVDFLLMPGPWVPTTMVWRVQGYYYHYAQGIEVILSDAMARIRIEDMGFLVVDLLDLDLEQPERRDEVLELALRGIEVLPLSPRIFSPPKLQ